MTGEWLVVSDERKTEQLWRMPREPVVIEPQLRQHSRGMCGHEDVRAGDDLAQLAAARPLASVAKDESFGAVPPVPASPTGARAEIAIAPTRRFDAHDIGSVACELSGGPGAGPQVRPIDHAKPSRGSAALA